MIAVCVPFFEENLKRKRPMSLSSRSIVVSVHLFKRTQQSKELDWKPSPYRARASSRPYRGRRPTVGGQADARSLLGDPGRLWRHPPPATRVALQPSQVALPEAVAPGHPCCAPLPHPETPVQPLP